jgi:hypothetical protein
MKNILKSTLLLMCGMGLFAACADDNDSNPTLQQPSTFVLNEPSYAAQIVALENSTEIPFTWSQPDYGFPAEVSYDIQASLTGNFTVSTDEANADESGATIPDYAVVASGLFGGSGSMDATTLDRNMVQIAQWTENTVPGTQTVYVRLAASTPGAATIYSNVVTILTGPYYIALKDAAPELWYLVGECVGDGSWNNSTGGIGSAIFPLLTLADETYDKVSGKGVIAYTGFFPGGKGFKLIKTPGDWAEQWGAGDAGYVKNDGGSGNITVPSDGYYTVKLDTKNDVLTIEPYDGSPRAFTSMGMPGTYQENQEWNPATTLMSPMGTAFENHDWIKRDMTFDSDAELKFAANGDWIYNWGSGAFPVGVGIQYGPNIPVSAGTYTVVFNDILGTYYFIEEAE